jgi:polyribonucleotide nucleotidyltransferase
MEDYYGDMDFKMAGTKTHMTAIQADVKLAGVPLDVITDAINNGTGTLNITYIQYGRLAWVKEPLK